MTAQAIMARNRREIPTMPFGFARMHRWRRCRQCPQATQEWFAAHVGDDGTG